jgi:GNAT superfamily N-acetyltransferase
MSSNTNQVVLRQFVETDFNNAWALTQNLKWAHRLDDWRFIHQFGGGWAAEQDGELVGTLLWSSYGDTHAALGLVIVADALQGKGIGRKLMTTAIAGLEGRNVGLNATVEGLPLYEKLGFMASGWLVQYQSDQFTAPTITLPAGVGIRTATVQDRDTLVTLLSNARGYDRSKLVDALLIAGDGVILEEDGRAQGCAFIRPFGKGYAIGPVIAPDMAAARALYAYWLSRYAGKFVRTDIDKASEIGPWLASIGLKDVGDVVRMERGPALGDVPDGREFAVVNQALA